MHSQRAGLVQNALGKRHFEGGQWIITALYMLMHKSLSLRIKSSVHRDHLKGFDTCNRKCGSTSTHSKSLVIIRHLGTSIRHHCYMLIVHCRIQSIGVRARFVSRDIHVLCGAAYSHVFVWCLCALSQLTIACSILLSMATTLAPEALQKTREKAISQQLIGKTNVDLKSTHFQTINKKKHVSAF